MKLAIAGSTAVVTGGSRGIGAATVKLLLDEGLQVAILARSEAGLRDFVAELGASADRALPLVADMAVEASISAAFERARSELGSIDVLVNNAGASPFGSFDDLADETWAEAFELKVLGYVRSMREVLPAMREQGKGHIVNVVGSAGRFADPGYVLGAYNAALLHITKSVADLVGPEGVRVLAVNPGLTSTDRMLDAIGTWAAAAGRKPEDFMSEHLESVPLGRPATPTEIARIVGVLCTDVGDLAIGSAFQADGAAPRGAF